MNSIFDLTRTATRRRNEGAVAEFKSDVERNGIGHAVSWGAVPAIVAEMVLDALTRFENAVGEYGTEKAIEMAAAVREDHQRRASYFDPTNTSTSASASMVNAAEFNGHQAIVSMIDELTESYRMDQEG